MPELRPAPLLLSLVFPVYEEWETLPHLRASLEQWASGVPWACEFVLVDDGSRDGSGEWLWQWAQTDPRTKVVRLSRNFGHQMAVTAGLAHARGDAVVILDADLQDPLEIIPEMVARYCAGYDVVYGRRSSRLGETWFKRTSAALFYRIFRCVAQTDLPADTGDFRLIARPVVEALRQMPEAHRFLRGLFAWVGFTQTAVDYVRQPRRHGRTKYPLRKMWRFSWNATLSFSTFPIRLITGAGFATAGFGFAYAGVAVWTKYVHHTTVPGWTGLVVLGALVGGMILISLGVIGEYIGRIYEEVKRRPLYLVRATANLGEPVGPPPGHISAPPFRPPPGTP